MVHVHVCSLLAQSSSFEPALFLHQSEGLGKTTASMTFGRLAKLRASKQSTWKENGETYRKHDETYLLHNCAHKEKMPWQRKIQDVMEQSAEPPPSYHDKWAETQHNWITNGPVS